MLGGFAAAAIAVPMVGAVPPIVVIPIMVATALLVGAVWVGIAGYLRYARGVNETISSLLLTYIGIAIMNFFVEGVMRDFEQSQQALDQADRRRLHGRPHPRHGCALGLRRGRSARPSRSTFS